MPNVNSKEQEDRKRERGSESSDYAQASMNKRDIYEASIFKSIEEGDRDLLQSVLSCSEPLLILQILLTSFIPNHDNKYYYESDVVQDGKELLGVPATNLNALQLACMLGDEELASDILEYAIKQAEELEARKILLEFLGKVWGDGNTVLHLASFLGMSSLVKRLIEQGANPHKRNGRSYRAVDCADDNETRILFLKINEHLRNPVDDTAPKSLTKTKSSSYTNIRKASLSSIQHSLSFDNLIPRKDGSNSTSISSTENKDLGVSNASGSKEKVYSDSCVCVNDKKKVMFDSYIVFFDILRDNDSNCVKEFLKDYYTENKVGLNLNYQNHMGVTPLHIIAEKGNVDLLKYFIDEAPRPFKEIDQNDAVEQSDTQKVNSLFINPKDIEGWTPLHSAAAEGHLQFVQLIISYGADLEAINDDEESVLDVTEQDSLRTFIEGKNTFSIVFMF